jgi:nucleoside-diphosphate-sugar epimerase
VAGDAMNRADVLRAAAGADVIVHAANPPGYRNWRGLALPMLDSTIAAAEATGATIVFPGTVYNFGPDAFPLLSETSPQRPTTRKGKVRVEMEQRLAAAAARGVQTIVVRAGDFFGPRPGNSWFSDGMIRKGRPLRSVMNPARAGVGHAWAYLPDVAETMARLVERRDELEPFAVFHFGGHWFDDNRAFAEAALRVAGHPEGKVRGFPWWAMVAIAPFVTFAYEMLEMRYLWRVPVRLDNRKLVATLGEEPHTRLETALTAALAGAGCLEAGAKGAAAAVSP